MRRSCRTLYNRLQEDYVISVRPPAVAGTFYPAAATELARDVTSLLAQAAGAARGKPVPKAIIAPHAGYIYSGPIAASVYARLAPARETIKRVILLGPVHRVPARGLALPEANVLATPLGNIPVDAAAVAALRQLPQITVSAAAHAAEHSLEVQLPFLQSVLAQFSLVPLAVGDATADEVAQVLDTVWGGAETLIVISSDMSHYLSYLDAQAADRATAQAILDLSTGISHQQACGGTPVNGLLLTARRRGLAPQLLDLRNSGDTAGDRKRVVGYGAFAFYAAPRVTDFAALVRAQPLDAAASLYGDDDHAVPEDAGRVLLPLARAAIAAQLNLGHDTPATARWLDNIGASFVTLMKQGELRGCIGTLEAHRPLGADVKANAVAAAFKDPRFKPLTPAELGTVRVEVSVLSAVIPMNFRDEADVLAQLRPDVDGVIFHYGHHRSTFLPQVWEHFRDPRIFMGQLKHKAGLPPDFWDATVKLSRYTVAKWRESTTD
jgi:AmmeMemoRadiSam system protein B/AmmeMemoRadiSam system protein A